MEEVRSYWQVASIAHFCTSFQKPFKLPVFEPEELEQAFIIDIPQPTKPLSHANNNSNNNNHDTNNIDTSNNDRASANNGNNVRESNGGIQDEDDDDNEDDDYKDRQDSTYSPDYQPPNHVQFRQPTTQEHQQPQQNDEQQQQELHLLVKLAIALLKPHFNSKISPLNWENYLGRLLDLYWVGLENCPSPFNVPIISPEGIELTKNLSFNELPLSDKIDVFCALCDYRFWCDDASELIKDYPVEELRLESIGKDQQGYEYWYFSGTRLFRENKDLSQELICRKKRIKELEYRLIELEKARILREKEEKRKAELNRVKQLANEAREARLAEKRQQEQDANTNSRKKRNSNTPVLPPRTGLRERRSGVSSDNNETETTPARTLRSRVARQQPSESSSQITPKASQSSSKKVKHNNQSDSIDEVAPELPKKSPEEECKEELESLRIKPEERKEAWSIHCESLEEWESFATIFEKTKSTNERYLSAAINEQILPGVRNIYAKRAAEVRRKEKELLFSLAQRRVSTRIISKRAQEEEEERQAQIREAEIQKKKAEAEIRLRAELEREMRARKNRFPVNGESSSVCSEDVGENGRYNLRQQPTHTSDILDEFDGIIHPDSLSEFYEALELIVDTVRISKHAWPFVDPVPKTVPGYYDLIEEPIDLKQIRTKVEFREYKSLIEIEKDFQLLVNNCERFNGPRNVYTKMVYKLWKSFRKNVQLYLQRDLHMDEFETFVYPPAQPVPPPPPPEVEPATELIPPPQEQQPVLPESESGFEPISPSKQRSVPEVVSTNIPTTTANSPTVTASPPPPASPLTPPAMSVQTPPQSSKPASSTLPTTDSQSAQLPKQTLREPSSSSAVLPQPIKLEPRPPPPLVKPQLQSSPTLIYLKPQTSPSLQPSVQPKTLPAPTLPVQLQTLPATPIQQKPQESTLTIQPQTLSAPPFEAWPPLEQLQPPSPFNISPLTTEVILSDGMMSPPPPTPSPIMTPQQGTPLELLHTNEHATDAPTQNGA